MTDTETVEIAPRRLWHELVDGEVVGRAEATTRPDARVFVAVDAWRPDVGAAQASVEPVGRRRWWCP